MPKESDHLAELVWGHRSPLTWHLPPGVTVTLYHPAILRAALVSIDLLAAAALVRYYCTCPSIVDVDVHHLCMTCNVQI